MISMKHVESKLFNPNGHFYFFFKYVLLVHIWLIFLDVDIINLPFQAANNNQNDKESTYTSTNSCQ